MNRLYAILIILAFFHCSLLAQQQVKDSSQASWSFSATGYYYIVPDDNSISFVGYADHKKLHLESRYNYEDIHTGSAFAGWRFETNGNFQFGATPMMGIVFGNTNGIAPGIELDATYKIFDYYSETEYVIDFSGKENNFFYVWGELAISPTDALRTGISYQRTRLYQTDRDVQRGVFAQYSFWKLTAGVYYFNPFSNSGFVIVSVGIDF